MVVPLLLAVCVGLVWLLAVGAGQVRTVDAAREAARAVARGDSEAEAVARAQQVAPEGARVAIARDGDRVVVTVTAEMRGPGGLFGHLPGAGLHAEAVAADEAASP